MEHNHGHKMYPVDIEFQNLSYCVQDALSESGYKNILQSLSGKFSSGNLTAILGSSGAGKTTLLNVLAGYTTTGVTGSINVNGAKRNMKSFKKISAYIMQGDLVHPQLSVQESMMIAANLKLSSAISQQDKKLVVNEIISTLCLEKCFYSRAALLSGGERKRFSIALELVNNPPVVFLDEPTSGIDNVAAKYCVKLLKSLASQGKTIICTIHQPSKALFEIFDDVYFMAEGSCTYNGTVDNLISFLSAVGLPCPLTYSPSDYIIELTELNHENISILSSRVTDNLDSHIFHTSEAVSPVYDEQFYNFQVSFWKQFLVLLNRNLLETSRNKTSLFILLLASVIISVTMGFCGYGIGSDAVLVLDNFKLLISLMTSIMCVFIMHPVLIYPSERKIVEREYFNRWYSLKAYYCSLLVSTFPSTIIMSTTMASIFYIMSGQPLDLHRIVYFTTVCTLMALTSHSLGQINGCLFDEKAGAIVAPTIMSPILVLSVYGMGYGKEINNFWKAMMQLSYTRYGLVGMCNAIYNDRADLKCSDIYCHFANSNYFLASMGMEGSSYIMQIVGMTFFLVLFNYFSYLALKFKFDPDHYLKRNNFALKVLNYFRRI